MATIPVNLEHGAWFTIIDPNQTSETELVSLHDHLLCKPWFMHMELVTHNKCLILTTKSNLPKARKWIDENLELMICKSIPPGIDPPSSHLPRQLDKPFYTATSRLYADILKKQFSLAPNPMTATDNNRPPCKRQATIIDYDSDQSAEYPPLPTAVAPNATSNNRLHTPAMLPTETAHNAYATDLLQLKDEINQLKTLIAMAVKQITHAIESLHGTPSTPMSNAMEIKAENNKSSDNPPESNHHHPATLDLSAIIKELQNDIAKLTQET